MSDLISRQAAIDEMDEWIKAFRENGHKESAADTCLIKDGIIQLPSIQPEIVRCKDCLRYYKGRNGWTCGLTGCTHNGDWYCADGERREE